MEILTEQDIDYISLGAAVLGSGGGGDPKVGRLLAKHSIQKYGPVKMISVDELKDDQMVVPVSGMGAPTVCLEKLPSEIEITNPMELLEKEYHKKADIVMPIEVGGMNSLYPFGAAAKRCLPILDADCMGRAFPEAQMESFYLHGIQPEHVAVADEKGNTVLVNPINGIWSEYLCRTLTVQMGGSSSVTDYFLSGKVVKKTVVKGTLSLARDIGKLILNHKRDSTDVFARLLKKLNGFELFNGKIIDVVRNTKGGFNFGSIKINGLQGYSGNFSVEFQNENLVAKQNEHILASVPDLIVLLDLETARPITTEHLHYGEKVKVVAFPCDPQWRTPKGIETVGPKYFGYNFDYVPVEELLRRAD